MEPDTGLWERDLHARLIARDATALADAYDQYSSVVFSVALRACSDRTAAQDVAQEVFLGLWRQPESFDPAKGSLRPWLATYSHHRATDRLRSEEARRQRERRKANEPTVAPPAVEEVVQAVLMAEKVRAGLASLPPAERTVLEAAFLQESSSYCQVARELELPEGTVKARIRSGLRRMAGILRSEVLGHKA